MAACAGQLYWRTQRLVWHRTRLKSSTKARHLGSIWMWCVRGSCMEFHAAVPAALVHGGHVTARFVAAMLACAL
eukprot:1159365-Pelagomonas_calceolata.AAC.3